MAQVSFWERVGGLLGRKSKTWELFREVYGTRASKSGVAVTVDRALQVATVLACVRVLANGAAQVPFKVYREANGRREVAKDHPAHILLHRRPNPWQTAFEFRETLMFHAVLAGNAYAFKNRVGSERVLRELILIEPHRVTVERKDDYRLVYKVRGDKGQEQEFPADAIWHVRGPSWNGWMGLEGVKLAREAVGLAISIEESQAEFSQNGAQTSGLYSVEDKLGPEAYDKLRAWLDKYAPGGEHHGKPMILDRAAKYTSQTMTGVDQQRLETRRHQVEEICRAFGVMPIMVGFTDKTATYASSEQMFLAHVVHSLSPWYARIENSADCSLLSDKDFADGLYTKFTPAALMRGAAKDRAEFYAKALGSGGAKGWMTQNEVRALEELDRDDDPDADDLPQPPAPAPAPKSPDDEDPPEDA